MKLHFSKIVVEHVFSLKYIKIDGVTQSHPVNNLFLFLMLFDVIACCLIF